MSPTVHQPLIAIVDDDAGQRELLRFTLEHAGYAIAEGDDGNAAITLARQHPVDLMLLDVRMPDLDGLTALTTLKHDRPELPVILLTAFIDVRDAVAAIKHGALDYLEKPVDLDELVAAVEDALGRGCSPSTEPDRPELNLPPGLIVESSPMHAVVRDLARVATTDASILLLGESGTGKEILARYVHRQSRRAAAPFVGVNCAALPENLIESELFGHERGAFTGATQARPGRFEEATAGTLLLDEIGEMPVPLQPKLLRVLEERTLRRVGGNRDIHVNPRVIAATHRQLMEDVRRGQFREDLLYRLNVITIEVPPLRERRDDILPLADHFLAQQQLHEKRLSPAAQRVLSDHAWPGNVRELRNAVVRAGILARGSLILPEDLPESVRAGRLRSSNPPTTNPLRGGMEEIQRHAILAALEQTGGNKTKAAHLLGISRRNLIYKLRSYGL